MFTFQIFNYSWLTRKFIKGRSCVLSECNLTEGRKIRVILVGKLIRFSDDISNEAKRNIPHEKNQIAGT